MVPGLAGAVPELDEANAAFEEAAGDQGLASVNVVAVHFAREGADVAQVYVGDTHSSVPRPAKELKGFVKVSLRPGETKRVSVVLDNRSLSYFDVANKQWRADAGDFDVLVGRSSQQIELRGKLTLSAPVVSPR